MLAGVEMLWDLSMQTLLEHIFHLTSKPSLNFIKLNLIVSLKFFLGFFLIIKFTGDVVSSTFVMNMRDLNFSSTGIEFCNMGRSLVPAICKLVKNDFLSKLLLLQRTTLRLLHKYKNYPSYICVDIFKHDALNYVHTFEVNDVISKKLGFY